MTGSSVVTVVLHLAVLIALLSIIKTLALSVFERTRELGLLRAAGMTRAQVRGMVRSESVVISLIGALTGPVLGIGIGLALAQALKNEGITSIAIPVTQLALYVGLAAVAGVLAALGPARSAAKVDVLRAVVDRRIPGSRASAHYEDHLRSVRDVRRWSRWKAGSTSTLRTLELGACGRARTPVPTGSSQARGLGARRCP